MWTKLDDGYTEHPKIAAAGPLAMALDIAGMVYCGRNLTDGFVPYNTAHGLLTGYVPTINYDNEPEMAAVDIPNTIKRLLDVQRWHDQDTVKDCPPCAPHWPGWNQGYYIHDYLEYNPSRETVMADRAKARDRMAEARSRKVPAKSQGSSTEVSPNEPRSAESREMFARTSAYPAPAPVPDPVEEKIKTLADSPSANGEMSEWINAPGLSGVQNRLVGKLLHPNGADVGTWARAVNKAKQTFPSAVVSTALGHMVEYEGEWVSPFAALIAECQSVAKKEPA